MSKNKIFLIFLTIILASSIVTSAENCFPEYTCEPWSQCKDGLQTRVCKDQKCGNRDIIERDFCEKPGCKPDLECGAWSQCFYTEKTNDLINGKVSFGGYRNRVCYDNNDCVDSFIQEGTCEEDYALLLAPVEECGQTILSVSDPNSKREVAKINLESWEYNRLDLSFVQGDSDYCPSCYNAKQDAGETGIDCGGDCKACKKESRALINSVMFFLWACSALFTFLFVREISLIKSGKNPQTKARTF
ncbi:MAG: hypothetical protein KC506_03850 [Nanoarchaeota archaeon]|nr:hypothetical protein [Nanoarchaeota archaeon]